MSVMIGATPIKSLSPSVMAGGVLKNEGSPKPEKETKAEVKKPKPKKEK